MLSIEWVKSVELKKVEYDIILLKIKNMYEIDLFSYRMSSHEGSSLFISIIFEAESAKSNKIRTL